MSVDQWISLFSASISFIGLGFVAIQLRDGNRQRRVESLLTISGVSREIISLGFSHPELFQVLHGQKADPIVERHYLQLWINQFELIHRLNQSQALPPDLLEALARDIRDFLSQPNMQLHWQHMQHFYPDSFQDFIEEVTSKRAGSSAELPPRKPSLKGS